MHFVLRCVKTWQYHEKNLITFAVSRAESIYLCKASYWRTRMKMSMQASKPPSLSVPIGPISRHLKSKKIDLLVTAVKRAVLSSFIDFLMTGDQGNSLALDVRNMKFSEVVAWARCSGKRRRARKRVMIKSPGPRRPWSEEEM